MRRTALITATALLALPFLAGAANAATPKPTPTASVKPKPTPTVKPTVKPKPTPSVKPTMTATPPKRGTVNFYGITN